MDAQDFAASKQEMNGMAKTTSSPLQLLYDNRSKLFSQPSSKSPFRFKPKQTRFTTTSCGPFSSQIYYEPPTASYPSDVDACPSSPFHRTVHCVLRASASSLRSLQPLLPLAATPQRTSSGAISSWPKLPSHQYIYTWDTSYTSARGYIHITSTTILLYEERGIWQE